MDDYPISFATQRKEPKDTNGDKIYARGTDSKKPSWWEMTLRFGPFVLARTWWILVPLLVVAGLFVLLVFLRMMRRAGRRGARRVRSPGVTRRPYLVQNENGCQCTTITNLGYVDILGAALATNAAWVKGGSAERRQLPCRRIGTTVTSRSRIQGCRKAGCQVVCSAPVARQHRPWDWRRRMRAPRYPHCTPCPCPAPGD